MGLQPAPIACAHVSSARTWSRGHVALGSSCVFQGHGSPLALHPGGGRWPGRCSFTAVLDSTHPPPTVSFCREGPSSLTVGRWLQGEDARLQVQVTFSVTVLHHCMQVTARFSPEVGLEVQGLAVSALCSDCPVSAPDPAGSGTLGPLAGSSASMVCLPFSPS